MNTTRQVTFLDRSTPPHLMTLILMAGISAAAMNIFLPSLNHMAEDFGVAYAVMQLSVPLFLLCSGLLQIVIGPLSDKFGRRRVMLWGFGVFNLATLVLVFAPTAEIFLLFRMIQAIVAVGMVLSRATVRDMYEQDQAASMIGYVTMGMALVPMIAPIVGGGLDALFGWQASLWLIFILGLGVMWLTWADMGETAVSSGLTVGQQFREFPELLTSPRFWGYAMASALSSGAFFSYLGGAPFIGSEVFGMSAAVLGIYFGAPAVGYAIGNFCTGRLAGRVGINTLILWGCIVSGLGIGISLLLTVTGYDTHLTFFGFMTFVGLGNGLVIPTATAGMLSVRPHLAGTASGLGGALMIVGGAALSALAGSVLTVESGAAPLLYIQFATAVCGVMAIASVFWREARLARNSDLQKEDLQT